ncbi:MAG: M28 family metallopeptidase, partial [Actinomycetota bacterium]|nr:M28 family metallopeptidase [Actinomycetota bacterium]
RRSFARRPINARTYRGTWLLVGIPLLIAAFSMGEPTALPRATLPPEFDARRAHQLVDELVDVYPNRRPGTLGAARAAAWVAGQLELQGFRSETDAFQATLPEHGRVTLVNVTATAPGRSPDTIVVMAHRDDLGVGPGAVDNASGTAALIELAGAYSNVADRGAAGPPSRPAGPAHTMLFLSTDGGAFGDHGARRFLERAGAASRIVAVVNLDSLGRRGSPGVRLAGDRPRSAPAALVRTASVRIADQTGREADVPGIVSQLTDLALPFTIYEHGVFVGRGIPAVTLTATGDKAPEAAADTPSHFDGRTLGELGRAAQALVASLDQALEVAHGTSGYLYLGSRTVRGWAVELVLVSALLPFLIAVVDLFARCRRRRLPLAPALASYRRRLAFWLAVGGAFALFALLGVWGSREAGIPPPSVPDAGNWPVLGVAGLATLAALGWLVARERLLPRRAVTAEEELAGATVGLLALGIVALVVAAVNPFALLFVLPSLHAWLWLPHVRHDSVWVRAAVLLAGFGGVALLLASFAVRFGLGLDAPWYVMRLAADGGVAIPLVVAFLAWLAAAGQLAAVSAGRYAPYPTPAERALRRPFRRGVRRLVLALRRPRKAAPARRRVVGG